MTFTSTLTGAFHMIEFRLQTNCAHRIYLLLFPYKLTAIRENINKLKKGFRCVTLVLVETKLLFQILHRRCMDVRHDFSHRILAGVDHLLQLRIKILTRQPQKGGFSERTTLPRLIHIDAGSLCQQRWVTRKPQGWKFFCSVIRRIFRTYNNM